MSTKRKISKAKKKSKFHLEISQDTAREIWGIIFAILAILSFLTLAEKLGKLGIYLHEALLISFGQGSFFMPPILALISLAFFISKNISLNLTRSVGIFFLFFGMLGFFHTFYPESSEIIDLKQAGGFLGFAASSVFRFFLSDLGARVVLLGFLLVGIVLTFPISISEVLGDILAILTKLTKIFSFNQDKKKNIKIISSTDLKSKTANIKTQNSFLKKEEEDSSKPLISKKKNTWQFPDLDLLSSEKSNVFADEKGLQKRAEKIREKLLEFGIEVKMNHVHIGPTVTQFTLEPAEGVKLSKIVSLKKDLTLALSAKSLRIEAPIPGKNLVGIEIPNEKRTVVHLREILESKEFKKLTGDLRLAFGRDVSGKAIAFDLSEMPHLLIAGATGAGKSVGMNTFLLSLLYQNSPSDLKMILIDPKRVELAPFNNIPHLLTPVITEAEKALSALQWAVAEMMRRYREMSEKGFRNITEFNESSEEKMPKIIIVIDELADLMMRQFKKDTENMICRLAQMARAVGMHLIIATQRPSVDIITGTIKANVPSRISFAVTSSIDSRTILDSIGAEDLLGKGDLLFSNSALGQPLRVQGILVTTQEVQRVTNHVKLTQSPEFDDSILQAKSSSFSGSDFSASSSGDSDDLLEEAIEIVQSSKKASASLLQRRLSVGYARAARILDIMEERGMIGPAKGAKPRDIFV